MTKQSDRAKRIDRLITELEGEMTGEDSILLIFVNGLEGDMSSCLTTHYPEQLVSATCELFDLKDDRGSNMIDLFSSAIITYAKAYPKFATKFIQTFNKVMYGVEI